MITTILQHLDTLHVELSAVDPAQDCDAAHTVADMMRALQRLLADVPHAEQEARFIAESRPARHAA